MSDTTATWSSPLLDLIFEEPGVGRCLVAPDGSVLRANAEWLRATGLSPDDVLGASLVDLLPEARDTVAALRARVRAGHRVEVPRHVRRLNGREVWWEGSFEPVPMEGETGLLLTVREADGLPAALGAADALPADDDSLRAILNATRESIWLFSADGVALAANEMALERWNRPTQELIGRSIVEFTPAPLGELRLAQIREVVRLGQPLAFEDERIGARWEHTLYPLRGKGARVERVVVYSRDVTQRHKERQLGEEALRRYEVLASQARDIVLVVRQGDGRILEANAAALSAYGYEREELLSLSIADLRAPDTRALLERQLAEAEAHGILFETVHRRRDGSLFPVEVSSRGTTRDGISTVTSVVRDITERQRTERALRQAEERYRGFFDNLSEAVVVLEAVRDTRGAVVDWCCAASNDAHQRLFGLTRQEVVGSLMSKVMGPAWVAKLNPRNARVLATGEAMTDETQLGGRWLRSTVFRIDSETVAISALDITEHRRLEEALRQGEEYLRTLIESVDVGVALIDEAGRFAKFNRRFLTLFGLVSESTIASVNDTDWGRWQVVDGEERLLGVDDHPVRKVAKTGVPVRNMLVGVRRPGESSLLWLLVSAEGMATPGGVRIICTYQDVTAMRDAELALREADRRKSEFLAVLSHELRNPLAPIHNSIHLLEGASPGSEVAQRARSVIRRQADHLTHLVDDLLDLTRITHGKFALQLTRLDARDVARRACDDIRAAFDQRSVELQYVQATEPLWVDADEARLAQMIGNLAGNALKFTQPGGQAKVATRASGRACEISVRDTGMGIDPADLDRIFEPFVQVGRAGPGAQSGLGIGLALVKDLAARHGGSVRVESEGLGRGAEFVLTIPLAAAPSDAVTRATVGKMASGLSVLIVEDNEDAGLSLADLLGLSGHQVKVVGTGRAGVEAISARAPDVLICDVGLPDLSGHEVIRTLRKAGSKVFAIAMTGFAQRQDREQALEAGFDAHLAKPADLRELNELMAAAAKKRP